MLISLQFIFVNLQRIIKFQMTIVILQAVQNLPQNLLLEHPLTIFIHVFTTVFRLFVIRLFSGTIPQKTQPPLQSFRVALSIKPKMALKKPALKVWSKSIFLLVQNFLVGKFPKSALIFRKNTEHFPKSKIEGQIIY